MKKLSIGLFLFFLYFPYSYSQTNGRLWGGIEIGYGIGLSDRGDSHKHTYSNIKDMRISTLKGVLGYYIIPELSIGAGIELSSYTEPGLNTLPICLDLRYHPLENKNFSLNSNIGYPLATSEREFKGRLLMDFSVGYKIINIGKLSLVPSVGYNYTNYSIESTQKHSQSCHSIFAKIGLYY